MRRPIAVLEALAPASCIRLPDARHRAGEPAETAEDLIDEDPDEADHGGDERGSSTAPTTRPGRRVRRSAAGAGRTRADNAVARAEAGDTEPPVRHRRRLPAWVLLRRVPLVLARLVLDLIPVLGFVVVGHLVAGSSIGGQQSAGW